MIRINKKLLASLVIGLSSVAAITGATAAWFSGGTTISFDNGTDNIPIEAGAEPAYYDVTSGDGKSADAPYVIKERIHLYNFAWLQYIGTYNQPDSSTGVIPTTYFRLDADIDMSSITLPPIGTDQYPFVGSFNGNGHVISNLTVSNDNPLSASSDFGVMKPSSNKLNGTTQPQIVGFFGVVGKLPSQSISYSSTTVSMTNFTLNNLTVKTKTSQTLIGLAAGYVDGAVSGVKVSGESSLDLSGQQRTAISSITNKLTDYGLVGYSANKGLGGTFSQNISEYYSVGGSGQDPSWGGSFQAKDYTTWFYDLYLTGNYDSWTKPSTNNAQLVKTVSGAGGYKVDYTVLASTTYNPPTPYNPSTTQVMYRFRDGAYIPLKFETGKTKADLNNTGYLVGSNVGTGVNASPKVGSYKMVNIGNAISNTSYTNLQTTYNSANISYTDSKLEILSYKDGGWKRIKDSRNENNNSTNTQISNYDRIPVADFNFARYTDSRAALAEALTGASMVHGIHFDNNQVSASNLLTISANTARINGANIGTTYQVPKGSINFNLKKKGIINFFAGTYNSSDVALNFFSLYEVNRNGGTISSIKEISKIYNDSSNTSNYVYQYVGGSKPGNAGNLVFDVETILKSNAPVKNMMYYFEIPVNAGEFAMGVAGSTQGAYMIYLDIGTNGEEAQDKITAYSITTQTKGTNYPIGVDFEVPSITGNGGGSICVYIASGKSGILSFSITGTNGNVINISDSSSLSTYSYKSQSFGTAYTVSGNSPGALIEPPGSGTRITHVRVETITNDIYNIRVVDLLDENGAFNPSESTYYLNNKPITLANLQSTVALFDSTTLSTVRSLSTVLTLARNEGAGTFDAHLPDLPWNDGSTYVITLDATGLKISVAIVGSLTVTINGTPVSNNAIYPAS